MVARLIADYEPISSNIQTSALVVREIIHSIGLGVLGITLLGGSVCIWWIGIIVRLTVKKEIYVVINVRQGSADILTALPASQLWSLEGRFVDFNSICDLEMEPPPPSKHVRQSGKWVFTGCNQLETKFRELLAIIIKIRNSSGTSRNLYVPMLSDVVVHTEKTSATALAFWYPDFWGSPGWVGEMEDAALEVELDPGVELDLLYLLPQFSGQATIEATNFGSLKL